MDIWVWALASLKITTKLVQVDAIVVDKDGRWVRNLKAEGFEVIE